MYPYPVIAAFVRLDILPASYWTCDLIDRDFR